MPYLLQCEAECEETLCHLAQQAARRTFLADCPDCRRIGAECRVHSVKAGRHPTSAQCSPAGAKKIADRRCKIGERLDLQGLRERFPCNCSRSKRAICTSVYSMEALCGRFQSIASSA